jgi:hypothetical protein
MSESIEKGKWKENLYGDKKQKLISIGSFDQLSSLLSSDTCSNSWEM